MGRLADMVEDAKRRALQGAASSGAMEKGARMAQRFMRARTRKGVDRHGRRFPDYSIEYGRRVKGRLSPVDLELSGQLLRSLSIRTNDDVDFDPSAGPAGGGQFRNRGSGRFVAREDVTFGATVNLKGSRNRKVGRAHIEAWGDLPERDWFGVTPNERTRIINTVGNRTTGGIRRELPDDRRRRIEIRLL
jgi:hypothetical protein